MKFTDEQINALAETVGGRLSEKRFRHVLSVVNAARRIGRFFPDIDISMLQKLSGFAKQSGIDKNQQTLLHALSPYISSGRIRKLEKAMRAAKLAGVATSFLGSSSLFFGR